MDTITAYIVYKWECPRCCAENTVYLTEKEQMCFNCGSYAVVEMPKKEE